MTEPTSTQKIVDSTMRFLAKSVVAPKKLRFGELLVQEHVISEEKLQQALALQKDSGQKIGQALVELGAISKSDLHSYLAKHLDIDVDLAFAEIPFYFCGQRVDLVPAAVHAVDRVQQIGLIDEREAHRPFEQTAQLVVGVYIGGIGHADQQALRVRLQHQRPMPAGRHGYPRH